MRQRRLKDLDERKARLDSWFIKEPEKLKGKWKELFAERGLSNDAPLYIEIGCGKGRFITENAKVHPDAAYVAIEGQESVIVKAMDKAEKAELKNLLFISLRLEDIREFFEKDEVDGIFLNFSDPWPKARHAKRRLTHRGYLKRYGNIIKPGGFIRFKTDNDDLFDFTLEEVGALGYHIEEITRDLHASEFAKDNILTEYERKFAGRGKNINYVKIGLGGGNMILAQENGRVMPKEDKIFALNGRAKKMIEEKGKDAVINATIGALLNDNGDLAVMQSVVDEIRSLKGADYAEYAPIGGIPAFKEAMVKAVFHDYSPKRFVEVVATPGGTGGIRNTVSNYSKPGDRIITCDWYWSPYSTICTEQGRTLDTYELFDEHGKFNIKGFAEKVYEVAEAQGDVCILLNTPAHNPTGYALDNEEWDKVVEILNDDRLKGVPVALFVDVAYIDFAGDPEEVRSFLPKLDKLNENVLAIIGYSASKTFTSYGMRTGAMICMAATEEIAAEFKQVCEFSSRNTWSNCNRSGQQVIANIFGDEKTLDIVRKERADFRDMLLERGKVFEEAAAKEGLDIVPFVSGFFVCVACDDPDDISNKLADKGIFVVPLAKGIRISVASISKEQCVKTVKALKEVLG